MPDENTNWRQFPAIEELFSEGRLESFLQQCEATCRQLDELTRSSDARTAERARAAMTAYGHTLQLLEQLAASASLATAQERAR
ncbi:MAG: hypothetical protein SFV54_22085 [Bryobacteraceae bacterium]|nr:hypothetical protein [Bryobacteraceae bacterium]